MQYVMLLQYIWFFFGMNINNTFFITFTKHIVAKKDRTSLETQSALSMGVIWLNQNKNTMVELLVSIH